MFKNSHGKIYSLVDVIYVELLKRTVYVKKRNQNNQ